MKNFKNFKPFDFYRYCCFISLLSIVALLSGCKESTNEKTIVAMDTVITLAAAGENAKTANEAAARFIENLDKQINFSENSELTKLNKASNKTFVECSPEVLELVQTGKYFSNFTKFAYNISAGKLVALWDTARENETVPTPAEIQAAKSTLTNTTLIESGKVKKSNADTALTFGGIAKGYAADKVYSIYKVHNVTGFLNFGTSTILACGEKTYRVGLKNPRDPEKILGALSIKNAALSTSGDYERYFIKNNVRYHHIIDPKTGYPAANGVSSATVIVPLTYENAGAMSDALSTALVVLGENGIEILPDDIGAVLVTADGEVVEVNGVRVE